MWSGKSGNCVSNDANKRTNKNSNPFSNYYSCSNRKPISSFIGQTPLFDNAFL